MTEPRIRRPVIVIGYGDVGADWLKRLAQRIASVPVLEDLLRDQVIQFWALGVDRATDKTNVTHFGDLPDVREIRRRLDDARLARFQAIYGLDPYLPVLVLERWSLFDESSSPRVRLRDAFSTARHVDCDPDKPRELDHLWVTLADAVRPAAPPAPAAIRRIRESFGTETLHDVPFLIDRQSEGGGVIDAPLADRCYYDFATAILTSDLGFPTREAGDRHSSVFSSDTDSGRVHPVAVLVLRHPESSILTAAAWDLSRTIREGDQGQLGQWASNASPLSRALESETAIRLQGHFTLAEARSRRNEAAVEALSAALVLRDTGVLRQDVVRTRRQVETLYPDTSIQMSLPAIAAAFGPGGISTAQLPLGLPETGFAVSIAIAAAAAVWWRRRNRYSDPLPAPDSSDSLAKAQLRTEWLSLLDRVESALGRLEWLFSNGEPSGSGTWQLAANHPFEWRFQPASVHAQGELALTQTLVHDLARRLLESGDASRDPADSVEDALRATASDLMSKRRDTYRTRIAPALAGDEAQMLRSALKNAQLLVNSVPPADNAEILWVADSSLELDEALVQLEPATMRHDARVLTSDDPSQTVRIRIGQALDWPAVLSLHFLAN